MLADVVDRCAVILEPERSPPLGSLNLAKVDQMQENLIAYFRIFAGLPGATFVEDDVTWFVNVKDEPGNHVLRTHISSDSIERRIDEIIAQFGQYTNQIDWLVFPACRPADLGKRLEARGMQAGLGGTWMLADLAAIPPSASSVPAGFHIQQVSDSTMLQAWQQISAEGFEGNAQIYYDAYIHHGFGPDACSLHYIGYLDDQPVTSSTLLMSGGIASVYDVSTPPAWRRQGFGGAITFAMLQEARRRGYKYAWIWSSPMGKSVYSKLGFVAADFGVREYRWRRR
jgi:GNAT superfamily N-acetyltransferase